MSLNIIFKSLSLFLAVSICLVILSGCRENQNEKNPSKENFEKQRENYLNQFRPEIERNSKVSEAITSVLKISTDAKVKAWHDFLSHWPLASAKQQLGFAWHKELGKFQGGVNASAVIEDRYALQIILDCDVSKDYAEVTFTKLRFHFTEVKEVQVPPEGAEEGGARVIFETSSDRWFDLTDWEQLRASSWDFSKIGINIIPNAPVPNIRSAF